MRLTIAGKDRTGDVGNDVAKDAPRLSNAGLDRLLNGEKDLLLIGNKHGGDAFLAEYIRLLRCRNTIDYTEIDFPSSRRTKLISIVRKVMWKLTRPFHDWFAFRQNSINRSLLYALEFENEQRRMDILRLEQEIERIRREKSGGREN